MEKVLSECKTCVAPKRHVGCHATCESYKKWCEYDKAQKENIRKQKRIQNEQNDHIINTKIKAMKRHGRKH